MPAGPSLTVTVRSQAQSLVSRLDPAGVRPTIIVGAFLLVFFFGSQFVNAVIPAPSQRPGGNPGGAPVSSITLGPLRILVPSGWQASQGPTGPRLAKGSVAIDIGNTPFSGDSPALYEAFADQVLRPNSSALSVTPPAVISVGGVQAVRGVYTGIFGEGGQIEGHVTALVVGGNGFIFDAWGPVGALQSVLSEVELISDTLVVE